LIRFIGKTIEKNKDLIKELEKFHSSAKFDTWEKAKNSGEISVIVDPPVSETDFKSLKSLLNNNNLIISQYPFPVDKIASESKIFYIPKKIPTSFLFEFIDLLERIYKLYNYKTNLKNLFSDTGLHMLLINSKGRIISVLTKSNELLGYKRAELIKKSFETIFDLPYEKILTRGTEGAHIHAVKNAFGIKKSIFIVKIPYKEFSLPGLPENADSIIILAEVLELHNIIEKSERNSTIQEIMIQKRAMELETANEVLNSQAMELKNALEQLEKNNRQIMEELSLASELQKSLLPKDFPSHLPMDISHKYIPFLEIGGDFYDVIPLDFTTIGIIITDVSGHGVASAFLTAMLKMSFTHYAPNDFSPAKTLSILNEEFVKLIRTEHYLTAFYAVIDFQNMKCSYCNAGHPRQLLFRKDGEVIELSSKGFFVGMFENTEYQDEQIDIHAGDKLCFFTDGIIETINNDDEQFGKENIIRIVNNEMDESVADIANTLMSDLIDYVNTDGFQDDITFLIMEII
jgi:serine phosphatase RsbU (regulator of sigma subunit)